jgi:hypothetical protein
MGYGHAQTAVETPYDEHMPIYALLIYAKNERADLTSDERRAVAAFAARIKATRKRK